MARTTRHERLGNIFARLESLVDNPPVDLVAKPGATEAINNLAKAFRKWLRANFPDGGEKVTEEEVKASVAGLRIKLFIFMKTMNQDK